MARPYKHALCIYPYRRELPDYHFCPPLGLEYIAASIEHLVDKITIVDMRYEGDITGFVTNETDLVCISVNWGFESDFFTEVIRKIPAHILTIVGGRHATANVVELFENCPNLDVIVRGDGEEAIRELLEKGSPREVAGVSYRERGEIIHNPNRELPAVNNKLSPNRALRRYRYRIALGGFDLGIEFDSISSSRGCPFNCKFCTFSMNPYGVKREWSARTPESVVEELKTIRAPFVGFTDDNFTYDMERVERICELIIKERIKKTFFINTRLDIAKRPDVLSKMYRAGFRVFLIGIESACDKSLKLLNKGFTIAQVRKAFEVLRKFPFIYHGYFIIGNIGETEKDMLSIAGFAREIGVDTLSLSLLRCEKYSPLKALIEKSPGYYIEDDGRVCSELYPRAKLRKIMRKVQHDFYNVPQILKVLKKFMASGLINFRIVCRSLQYVIARFLREPKIRRGSNQAQKR